MGRISGQDWNVIPRPPDLASLIIWQSCSCWSFPHFGIVHALFVQQPVGHRAEITLIRIQFYPWSLQFLPSPSLSRCGRWSDGACHPNPTFLFLQEIVQTYRAASKKKVVVPEASRTLPPSPTLAFRRRFLHKESVSLKFTRVARSSH